MGISPLPDLQPYRYQGIGRYTAACLVLCITGHNAGFSWYVNEYFKSPLGSGSLKNVLAFTYTEGNNKQGKRNKIC